MSGSEGKITRTPYELPDESKKQIIAATNNKDLIKALEDIAKKEGGQVCLLREGTPDLIPFNGNVRVVDRMHMGKDNWETFCEFLKDVNKDDEYPIRDEDGEILIEEPIYDQTPIIIIDDEGKEGDFLPPKYALGEVQYISQNAPGVVKEKVKQILRGNPYPVMSMVVATKEGDYKGERLV